MQAKEEKQEPNPASDISEAKFHVNESYSDCDVQATCPRCPASLVALQRR